MTTIIATWGVLTVLAVLANALVKLGPLAAAALAEPLGPGHIAFGVAWTAFMLFYEGYRGFQRSFSPRVVARAFWLGAERRPLDILLAPAFCIGLYRAPRSLMIVVWSVLVGVTLLVIAVGKLPQPWRGLVDIGVLAGLGWGALWVIILFVRGLVRPEGRTDGARVPTDGTASPVDPPGLGGAV